MLAFKERARKVERHEIRRKMCTWKWDQPETVTLRHDLLIQLHLISVFLLNNRPCGEAAVQQLCLEILMILSLRLIFNSISFNPGRSGFSEH